MKILVKSYFFVIKWVIIFSIDFDKVNLDNDKNVDEMILKLLFTSKFCLGIITLKNAKHLTGLVLQFLHSLFEKCYKSIKSFQFSRKIM